MKRTQAIQPAPQASKPRWCPCGVDLETQHQCRWRSPTDSTGSDVRAEGVATYSQTRPNVNTAQQRRIMVIGSLPSRRRKPKSTLSSVDRLSAQQRQVRLKGMPLDVFHPEPFCAYPIPTIGVVHRMVEHFLHVWAPQQGTPFGFEGHPNPYMSLLWPFALQDATIFEGIIAMCRASWLLEHGQDTMHDRAFNYHHNRSKHALQKRLESPTTCCDDTTLLSVLALTTIDYTLGEHSLAEQYLQSMRHMIALRGGTRDDSPWNKFLASVVSAFEVLWSFILSNNQQANSADVSVYDQPSQTLRNAIPVYANHPFPPDYAASLARIPRGFSNMAVSSMLSMQCVQIIERTPFTSNVSGCELRPTSSRINADLYSILTDLLKLTTLSTTKMEHVLCYGLVAYCLPLQYGTPLPIGCTRTLQACVEAYMRLNFRENEEKLDGKCLLWIAIVIASCLDVCADEDLRTAPVLERVMSRFPEARRWDKVERILRTFLWHDDLASQWHATWQGVMRRRESPTSGTGVSPHAFSPSTVANNSPAPFPPSASATVSPIPLPNPVVPKERPTLAPQQHRSMKVSNLLVND